MKNTIPLREQKNMTSGWFFIVLYTLDSSNNIMMDRSSVPMPALISLMTLNLINICEIGH